MPPSNSIFKENELITSTISPRNINYYLVTESEMNNLETHSYIQDLLLFISSIFGAAFLGLYLTKFSNLSALSNVQIQTIYTLKIITLIIFIISFFGSIIFFIIRRRRMKSLQKSTTINSKRPFSI